MSEKYKHISKRFKRNGHFWIATDEPSWCGEEFVVLKRVGIESQLKTLKENEIINPKISVSIPIIVNPIRLYTHALSIKSVTFTIVL